jgi:hypothetical protein
VSARADASTAAARREAKDRAALIAAYREGLGLTAIVVIQEDATARIVAIDAPHAQAGTIAPQGATRWWCRRAADAERIVASATRSLRRESKDETSGSSPGQHARTPHHVLAAHVLAAVESAARRLGIPLYSDADVAADAEGIIGRVEEEIEKLKRAGELKSVNQSYRAYRLQASSRGEKAAPYAVWLNQYKANLVRELATALRYA